MAEEEKGFVIRDRRSFDDKGDLRDRQPPDEEVKADKTKEEEAPSAEREKEEPEEAPREEPGQQEEERSTPLPEVNFSSLVMSLSSTALFHFGEIADPQTGKTKKDLPLAKHAIDTLSMLREKTQGNLTEEEQKFLDSILTDLKWRYVDATK